MNTQGSELINTVVNKNLCLSCGLCASICRFNALKMTSIDKECVPIIDSSKCTDCGLCMSVCPGIGIDIHKYEYSLFKSSTCSLIGSFKELRTGYSSNNAVRKESSSGGIVSELLSYILETKYADQIIALGFNNQKKYLSEYKVIKNSSEIKTISQSKYSVNHLGDILKIIDKSLRTVIVALPCQVHGIRKWQSLNDELKNIKLIIGLYCGNNLYFSATKDFLKKAGVKDLPEIELLNYRNGRWPGNIFAKLKDGTSISYSKDCFNLFSFPYTIPRCHLCPDLTNELADISAADAWKYEGKDKDGRSLIISRSIAGEEILKSAIENKRIVSEGISIEDVLNMHAHNLKRKKYGSMIRTKYKGKHAPDFNLKLIKRPSFLDFIKHVLIYNISSGIAAKIFVMLCPLSILNYISRNVRLSWKKRSSANIYNKWEVSKIK